MPLILPGISGDERRETLASRERKHTALTDSSGLGRRICIQQMGDKGRVGGACEDKPHERSGHAELNRFLGPFHMPYKAKCDPAHQTAGLCPDYPPPCRWALSQSIAAAWGNEEGDLGQVRKEAIINVAQHVLDSIKANTVVESSLSGHHGAVNVGGVGGILDSHCFLRTKHCLQCKGEEGREGGRLRGAR